jgi:tetraacyldisaccharide 4'-kinase
MFLERYILEIIEGQRSAPLMTGFLKAASSLYRLAVRARHLAYDRNWLKGFRPPATVVSVGNVVSGGVGKTPVVKKLAEALSQKRNVAILTRGFRSPIERSGRSVLWQGESAAICGDEPFWLASQLSNTAVWIGRERRVSAALACEQGADLLLLDDGMQHRQLVRDLEIVVMDAEDLWGKGHFLPRGFLRDLPCRLKFARLIVLTQANCLEKVAQAQAALAVYTDAPIVAMQLRVQAEAIQAKKVGVFCAIARPERFVRTVEGLGAEIVAKKQHLDHFPFTKEELEKFARECQALGAQLLVCTEKDAVKLSSDSPTCLPIVPLKAELEIIGGKEYWDQLIEELSHDRRI